MFSSLTKTRPRRRFHLKERRKSSPTNLLTSLRGDIAKRGRLFAHRKVNRIIEKNGDLNVAFTNIHKRRMRYLADLFTTLIDLQVGTSVFIDLQVGTSVFIDLQVGTSVFIDLQVGTSVFIDLQVGTSVFIDLQVGTSVFIDLQVGTSVFIDLQVGTSVFIHLQVGTSVFIDLQVAPVH